MQSVTKERIGVTSEGEFLFIVSFSGAERMIECVPKNAKYYKRTLKGAFVEINVADYSDCLFYV